VDIDWSMKYGAINYHNNAYLHFIG